MDQRRRRGLFEGLPRVLYRRYHARYFEALALGGIWNGVAVAGFGLIALALYVDVDGDELAVFAACSTLVFALESALAGRYLLRAARPARAWLAGDRSEQRAHEAWSAAASLPLALLRRPGLYVVGAIGVGAADLLLAALLDLPASDAVLLVPASYLLYISSIILRFIAFELAMRPFLEEVGRQLPDIAPPASARVTLHQRLIVTVPMVTWGTALMVAGLVTDNSRDFDTIGLAGAAAFAVTAAVSMWLGLVLADTVSAPVIDLRDAARRVGEGDLSARVAVVSTDETGELAAAFNTMLAGLSERKRLHEAFGTFVDPALTERVLAEGTDLRGEEVEASVLFVDVRDFTEFAERSPADQVVACLNVLYEAIVPVIDRHGGHANKFVGDGLLAVFGTPDPHPDHAARAVAAATEIAELMRAGAGGELRVGVGVNTGRVVAGTIGGGGRREFTVIGDAVNTAARVEAATRDTGDEILITETTLRALGESTDFEERPPVPLKGKAEEVRLFAPRSSGSA